MSDYYETRYTYDKGRAKVWKAITEYLQIYVNKETDQSWTLAQDTATSSIA
jgi:hypothetical protein